MSGAQLAIENPEENLNNRQITQRIEDAGEKAKVSPLDPDFLLILLLIALPFDVLSAILEIINMPTLQISKVISFLINMIPFVIICGWSIWRTGQMVKAREEQKKSLEKAISKQSANIQKQLARQMTKTGIKAVTRRLVIRGAIAFLGSSIHFIAFIPFWTITIILTLKEK